MESLRGSVSENEKQKAKERQKRKFDTLIREHEGNRASVMSHVGKWVINLSSKQLSDQQEKVLAKGLKFAPAPKSIPIKEIIAAVEPALRTAPQQAAANARVRIVSLLSKAKPPQSNISKESHV